MITHEQENIILHASGLSSRRRTQFRNYYFCGVTRPEILTLVEIGLAEGPYTMNGGRHGYFYLTKSGIDKAWEIAMERSNREAGIL